MRDSFMHQSPMLTDHDVAIGLHSDTPIQVAGGGGGGAGLAPICATFFTFLLA